MSRYWAIISVLASLIVFLCFTPSTASYVAPVPEKTFDTELVRLALNYHQSEKLARAIISCESSMYDRATNVNKNGSIDIGFWQINNVYWEKQALSEGFDIKDKWQNLEYGFILLQRYGTSLWNASKPCWNKVK